MAFLHATKGNAYPGDKPRVYFTCHPNDFDLYFEQTCDDLFRAADCAVYYTEDMTASLDDANSQVDLERMQLFVIPVTYRLLTNPSRALDSDLKFASEKDIPVLPLMMETGLDALYAKTEAFGERQYLVPDGQDATEVSFDTKLGNYLESVLISAEMAERIRKAFDAYIFLSYRKKDRAHANELMRLIHDDPECSDVAIWFDEFLTPGESFAESIEHALKKSELFALLVTPHVLEMQEGKPNFVMGEEYPAARSCDMDILPAMMEETDEDLLQASFEGIPECIDVKDDEAFRERFLAAIRRVAVTENDDDPEHNYLIGLAYRDGIDVERDVGRAFCLITKAAEAGHLEAMKTLHDWYVIRPNARDRTIAENWKTARDWTLKRGRRCVELYGAKSAETLNALDDLANDHSRCGDDQRRYETRLNAYKISRSSLGDDHPDTIRRLSDLAVALSKIGEKESAVGLAHQACEASVRVNGIESPRSEAAFCAQAHALFGVKDYRAAGGIFEVMYEQYSREFGKEHRRTLEALGNVAYAYGMLGDHQKALTLLEDLYEARVRTRGENHPSTLYALYNMAYLHRELGNYREAIERHRKAYRSLKAVLGLEHPDVRLFLRELARTYYEAGDHRNALKAYRALYNANVNLFGFRHEKTLVSLISCAQTIEASGSPEDARQLYELIHRNLAKLVEADDPNLLDVAEKLEALQGHEGAMNAPIQGSGNADDVAPTSIGPSADA